jgi:hypothetical protein
MAGFFAVLYAYYLFHRPNINRVVYWMFIFICAALVVISFSKSTITVFFLVTLLYLMKQKQYGGNAPLRGVIIIFVTFVSALFFKASTDPLTISKRITLTLDSLSIIKSHAFIGTGLGNYLYAQADYPQHYPSFILQPVHNILLLLAAEVGIPVFIILSYFFVRHIRSFLLPSSFFLPFAVILLTGMLDHYWFTLQQNWLLLGVVWGLTHRELKTVRDGSGV